MSLVTFNHVEVLNKEAPFTDPFKFNIQFSLSQPLAHDLEFKLVYLGSSDNTTHDQVLESMMVGPCPVGVCQFIMEAPPPNPALIPACDVLGIGAVMLTVSYLEKEFIRIGWYVNNEYENEEMNLTPPETIDFNLLKRSILADKPRGKGLLKPSYSIHHSVGFSYSKRSHCRGFCAPGN